MGLGAICDLLTRGVDGARSLSFSVSEFALLDDGRRVILHEDRGFTIGSGRGGTLGHETPETITSDVLNVVLPDDDDSDDDHPWSWLAELCRARGLDVTADDLRDLPYMVILSDSVRGRLARS